MRRVPRWWLVPIVALVVVAGLVGAYFAGAVAAEGVAPEQTTTSAVPVSAAVERRAVAKQVAVAGKVVAGAQVAVTASAPPGVDRLVVTSVAKAVGDDVAPGDLLAVVSGRPVLVLQSRVPLYRDLADGDKGPDVTELQEALAALGHPCTATGTFDAATQRALSKFYAAAGSTAPAADSASKAAFRWREFVQLPGDRGKLSSISHAGTVLEDGTVARITIADDAIVARADLLQAESFPVGTPATVRAGSAVLEAKVAQVSGFKDGDPNQKEVPGKDLMLPLPPGTAGFAPDQSVTVTAGPRASESLAVPLIAIRQEGGTAYVEVESGTGSRRVGVKVTAQTDGWAALADMEGLSLGDRVRLP
ncbi:hypothetical protein LK10_06910 [Sinomonas humi]|uniref:Peptidoglycan binding-like domain-containing protein n=2 Tax=Sinomonas humi TaxID=1338436 RepID=A0A0B2ALM5_9MICC|nr:hypothetical protein LK10_06910 [Sinomonas humi]